MRAQNDDFDWAKNEKNNQIFIWKVGYIGIFVSLEIIFKFLIIFYLSSIAFYSQENLTIENYNFSETEWLNLVTTQGSSLICRSCSFLYFIEISLIIFTRRFFTKNSKWKFAVIIWLLDKSCFVWAVTKPVAISSFDLFFDFQLFESSSIVTSFRIFIFC